MTLDVSLGIGEYKTGSKDPSKEWLSGKPNVCEGKRKFWTLVSSGGPRKLGSSSGSSKLFLACSF